jgi:membrane-associated phospholipid phosphatase
VPAMKNFSRRLANACSWLSTIVFFRIESRRTAALKFFLAALCLLLADTVGAEDPASWPRWLESGSSPIGFSLHALSRLPDESVHAAIGGSDATQSLLNWTEQTLRLVQKYQQNPQRAVRTLSIVHATMHDAFVLAAGEFRSATPGMAAAHRAVSLTLAYLYPYESVGWIEGRGLALAHAWAGTQRVGPARLERELQIGDQVAGDAIRRALTDGSDRRSAAPPPLSPDPGRWRAAPPLNIHVPQEPLAGEWRPWVRGSSELQPPPPPVYDSPQFWAETEEVYQIWKNLTPKQKAIADDWNLQAGSVTPPGVWNQRAIELIRSEKLGPAAAARVLAALNIAMNDAAIACWLAKYRWWRVRPVTAIRERFDPNFLPHLITPPHPSYVSGHSSVSGAAEVALAAFFPERKSELHAYAEEAAMSRLWGGIHYRSDDDEGLRLGRRVAERVMRQALAVTTAPNQRDAGRNP